MRNSRFRVEDFWTGHRPHKETWLICLSLLFQQCVKEKIDSLSFLLAVSLCGWTYVNNLSSADSPNNSRGAGFWTHASALTGQLFFQCSNAAQSKMKIMQRVA
ncbi:hypothetical protein SUGI_1077860 [Cryptomeria japonica]|nr:hypothetical protein SUGI_1077860 [Cryptomeria japonica]